MCRQTRYAQPTTAMRTRMSGAQCSSSGRTIWIGYARSEQVPSKNLSEIVHNTALQLVLSDNWARRADGAEHPCVARKSLITQVIHHAQLGLNRLRLWHFASLHSQGPNLPLIRDRKSVSLLRALLVNQIPIIQLPDQPRVLADSRPRYQAA